MTRSIPGPQKSRERGSDELIGGLGRNLQSMEIEAG